jgi:flagellar M-ring protein FliF
VKRIAAAIVVDDAVETKTEGGKTQETRRKRTPDEMKQLEELARAAVGFDEKRGDQFSMQNISFTQPTLDTPAPPGKFQRLLLFLEQWTFVLRYIGLLALFGLVYALILRPVKKQVLALLRNPPQAAFPAAAVAGAGGAQLPDDAGLAGLPDSADVSGASEVRQAVSLKKQLVTKVKQDPEAASRLIQNWLNEKEPKQ